MPAVSTPQCWHCAMTNHRPHADMSDVAVGSSNGDGVGAQPCLGVGFAIKFLNADCNTRFIKGHKPSNHIHDRIKSHVYTTE